MCNKASANLCPFCPVINSILYQATCVEACMDHLNDLSGRLLGNDITVIVELVPQNFIHLIVRTIARSHHNLIAFDLDFLAIFRIDSITITDLSNCSGGDNLQLRVVDHVIQGLRVVQVFFQCLQNGVSHLHNCHLQSGLFTV